MALGLKHIMSCAFQQTLSIFSMSDVFNHMTRLFQTDNNTDVPPPVSQNILWPFKCLQPVRLTNAHGNVDDIQYFSLLNILSNAWDRLGGVISAPVLGQTGWVTWSIWNIKPLCLDSCKALHLEVQGKGWWRKKNNDSSSVLLVRGIVLENYKETNIPHFIKIADSVSTENMNNNLKKAFKNNLKEPALRTAKVNTSVDILNVVTTCFNSLLMSYNPFHID